MSIDDLLPDPGECAEIDKYIYKLRQAEDEGDYQRFKAIVENKQAEERRIERETRWYNKRMYGCE